MNYVLGLIDLHEDNSLIKVLTKTRPVASIPFVGRYRLIDFPLSSMVNSGVVSVGVMLQDKASSILDHLKSGKDWDLARHHAGLFYLSFTRDEANDNMRDSDLYMLYKNIERLRKTPHEYILMMGGNAVFNMDFGNVLRFHQNTSADITIVYCRTKDAYQTPSITLETKETGKVTDIAKSPDIKKDTDVSLGIYLMSRKIFLNIVEHAYERGGRDFLLDGIMRSTDKYNIYGYRYGGYTAIINSLADYYEASMDLLNPKIWRELFIDKSPIYTKVKDDVPAQYKSCAKVSHSLITNGCIIDGTVENSILFRDVVIKKGAVIKNSIIMQTCQIGENSYLENVICDKGVKVSSEKRLCGAENYPFVK